LAALPKNAVRHGRAQAAGGVAAQVALAAEAAAGTPQVVDTLGGRLHVRWDDGAAATPHGLLVFFAEFLATAGVFERWVSSCPLPARVPQAEPTCSSG
jgi:hypothetical protein